MWHQAHLRLIGNPDPLLEAYAADVSDPGSPSAGIPKVFLDDTYHHPENGLKKPNPLKFALAKGGLSKSSKGLYVTRDETLVTER